MKLPKRGCLRDTTTGEVKWAWEHNDPDRDFDVLPPVVNKDGVRTSLYDPAKHEIVDLEHITEVGDVPLLYDHMSDLRIHPEKTRNLTGGSNWKLTKIQRTAKGKEVETLHPLHHILADRKALKEQDDEK